MSPRFSFVLRLWIWNHFVQHIFFFYREFSCCRKFVHSEPGLSSVCILRISSKSLHRLQTRRDSFLFPRARDTPAEVSNALNLPRSYRVERWSLLPRSRSPLDKLPAGTRRRWLTLCVAERVVQGAVLRDRMARLCRSFWGKRLREYWRKCWRIFMYTKKKKKNRGGILKAGKSDMRTNQPRCPVWSERSPCIYPQI